MNAKQARELTDKALDAIDLSIPLSQVHEKITEEANKGSGQSTVVFQCLFLDSPIRSTAQAKALHSALEKEGYKVIMNQSVFPGRTGVVLKTVTYTISW